MWHQLIDHLPSGGAVRDYSLASMLTSAPIWVPYLNEIATPVLTFICVLTGAVIGVRRVWHDFRKPKEPK